MKNKKNILYFVSEDWYFVSHRIELAKEAKKKGYEVTLLANMDKEKDYIESAGIKTIHLPIQRSKKNLINDFFLLIKAYRIIKKEKPNILHCVSLKPILYGTICSRVLGKIKVINTFAGLGVLINYQNNSLKRKIINIFLRLFIKSKSVKIIVQNQSDKNFFIKNNIVEEKNINLILGSGVDMTKFFPSTEIRKSLNIILVSRMLWSKGVGEFVEIAKKFKNNELVSFTLLGKTDAKNLDSVPIDFLESLTSLPNLEWKGHTDNVVKELHRSDIFFLPTSYGEGIPKALIEAAACGLPLVSSNNSGCLEVVENNRNGYVINKQNLEECYDAIKKLIESRELRLKFGKFSRNKVKEDFSIENINNETINLYSL
ncbi:MAG: hypothetical protein CMQ53_00885 [Gammaproteobacteria bacterium]|nr:hypothetical protein [Gammaproteobacteria bacterium]|tara:strand:- start:3672 stop:4787 length:1116 start_codon:yes stop_codon:yes gene_type:complete